MDYAEIKDLIMTIEDSNLMEFELKIKGDTYIKMSYAPSSGSVAPAICMEDKNLKAEKKPAKISKSDDIKKEAKIQERTESVLEPITIIPEEPVEVKEGNIVVSPMVGTFYASSAPQKPPYVKVGSKVKEGDVLCVIEAMKIMNEITSKFDGEIAEIMAVNEDMVEYGQELFRIV